MNSSTRGTNNGDGSFTYGKQAGTKDMPKFVQEFNYRKVKHSQKHSFFYTRKTNTGSHIQSFGVKLAAAIRHN